MVLTSKIHIEIFDTIVLVCGSGLVYIDIKTITIFVGLCQCSFCMSHVLSLLFKNNW